jgi:hypothetical protein
MRVFAVAVVLVFAICGEALADRATELAAKEGITVALAEHDLKLQAEGGGLQQQVESRYADCAQWRPSCGIERGAAFGGFYFDNKAGVYVITGMKPHSWPWWGCCNSALISGQYLLGSRLCPNSDGAYCLSANGERFARFSEVPRSMAQLEAEQAEVNAEVTAKHTLALVWITPVDDSVHIEVNATGPQAVGDEILRKHPSLKVTKVKHSVAAHATALSCSFPTCEPLMGGAQINSDQEGNGYFSCTAGFSYLKEDPGMTRSYMITAGHCLADAYYRNSRNTPWNNAGGCNLYPAAWQVSPSADVGVLDVSSCPGYPFPQGPELGPAEKTVPWNHPWPDGFPWNLIQPQIGVPYVGEVVCADGSRNGDSCGPVEYVKAQTPILYDPPFGVQYVQHSFGACTNVIPGDSGGPIEVQTQGPWWWEFHPAYAEGIIIAAREGSVSCLLTGVVGDEMKQELAVLGNPESQAGWEYHSTF